MSSSWTRNTVSGLLAAIAIAALLLIGAAGCGGGDGGGDTSTNVASAGGGGGELTHVAVQDTAGLPTAFLQYGVQKGFFAKQGLDVEVKTGQGGAAAIPSLLSGDIDFTGSNIVSTLIAAQKGLPLRIVAPNSSTGKLRKDDPSAIVVRADGPIKTAKDLEGKSIAVNTLDNISEITAHATLAKQGVDFSKVKLTELPFPEMWTAVEKGRVDAAFVIEPFFTLAKQAGARAVARPFWGTMPSLQIGVAVTTEKFAAENPDTVRAYQRGLALTADSVMAHPDAFRKVLPKFAKMPPALARKVILFTWTGDRESPASFKRISDLMVRYGVASEVPDYRTLLVGEGGASQ